MEISKTLPQVRHCCIQSCINFKGTTSDKFHFFKPAMEKHILEKWKEAISQHQEIKNITILCNLHFEHESLIEMEGQLFLKHGSVPSIFDNIQSPETREPVKEVAVKVESVRVEKPNGVQLVNINRIIQNAPTLSSEPSEIAENERINRVESGNCNGCNQRDIRIQNMLVNLNKLKKANEHKIKQIRYWKSLAIYHKRGKNEPVVVRINKSKVSTRVRPVKITTKLNKNNAKRKFAENVTINGVRHVAKKRREPVEISTELIKVEGKPADYSDIDEPNTSVKPTITIIETVIDDKVNSEEVDIKVNEPSVEIVDRLLIDRLTKPYKCGRCNDAFFEKPQELSRHMLNECIQRIRIERTQSNSQSNIYECYICKKEMKLLANIRKHMKLHTEITEKCIVCQYNGNQIDQHLCIPEESLSCEHCPTTYSATKRLLEHLETDHNDKKKFKCTKCNQHFKMMFLKIIHEKIHDNFRPFDCDICSKSFTYKESLLRHQGRSHTILVKPDSRPSHLCDQCGKGYYSQSRLATHFLSHEDPKIKCPDCPQLFRTKNALDKHSYLHRDEKFVCSICGAERSSPGALRRHLQSTHDPNTKLNLLECKICGKIFKKKNLQKHMVTHSSSKSAFECTFCSNTYKYKGDLNKHLRTHLGDNIYACEQCSKRFRTQMELHKHSFKHYKEQQISTEFTTEE